MWRLVLLGLAACGGGDDRVDSDGGADAGLLPEPPAPPEPPASPAPPLDDACPEGEWAAPAPGEDVVYVRAGEPAGGDGTDARPLATMADALASAPDGATILLSRGTFSETFVVDRPLFVRGACASETVLATDEPDFGGALATLTGGARGVADVTLTGVRRAILVDGAPDVALDRVVVSDVDVSGLTVLGASTVRATDLVVRDVAAQSGYSVGIEVAQGSTLELERAVVERATAGGLLVYGATASARDLAILDTLPEEPEGTGGDGIVLLDAAVVTLERAVVQGGFEWGVAVRRAGTRLEASDLSVTGIAGRVRDGGDGFGLLVDGGASVTLARARIMDTASSAVRVAGEGSLLDATDLEASAPIDARADATASVVRTHVQGSAGIGAVAVDGGRLQLADARIADVALAGELGHCAAAARQGSVSLERFVLARCPVVGLQLGPLGAIELADGTIAGSALAMNAQEPGSGWDAARLGERVALEDNERDWSDEPLPVPP